jgi:hypothetical protein
MHGRIIPTIILSDKYEVEYEVLKAASMKMAALWVAAPCSLVHVYRQQTSLKRRWISTRIHCAASQKTVIFRRIQRCNMFSRHALYWMFAPAARRTYTQHHEPYAKQRMRCQYVPYFLYTSHAPRSYRIGTVNCSAHGVWVTAQRQAVVTDTL